MDPSRLLLFSAFFTLAVSTPIAAGESGRGRPPPSSSPSLPLWTVPPTVQHTALTLHDGSRDTSLSSRPAPTPAFDDFNDLMKPIFSRSTVPAPGCTTTIVPNPKLACPWDGTSTDYPSTITLTRSVDCNGCAHVNYGLGLCPAVAVNERKTAKTAFTEYITVCETSTARPHRTKPVAAITTGDAHGDRVPGFRANAGIGSIPRYTGRPDLAKRAEVVACPTTYVAMPEQQAGKTATSYSKYTTTTIKLNCGGCPLVVATALVAYGPPTAFTKTTTLPVGAKTTWACS